ncbi:hypothetical protein [Natranaerofaba carboxydovora]|uniref:hypothetical protein n=1 Tax=Natranaerofaba carboxydovora TaxID=2742683 RepID=UPI001F143B1E|nr:hypothetical protein [Natranaerofaba carboxydovora]UMZ74381.1 hypothetical protein ACONDI_01969 [Natranaerofaba carboxydovora]
MNNTKLYNVIFPIWLIIFVPPILFISILGNFLIDSVILILGFKIFNGYDATNLSTKQFYKMTILKVWILGFLADSLGVIPLMVSTWAVLPVFELPNEVIHAISYNPFSNIWGFVIVLLSIFIAGILIYVFNYKISFKYIQDKTLKFKLAVILAIVTAPWTLLVPTELFV